MALIGDILGLIFGNGRNALRETVEVFRENAEAGAERGAEARAQAMVQFAAEFAQSRPSRFDRLMDGVNRLPRPMMALGTLGLFVAAMIDPLWFAERMQGIALVPEPLWWLLGVIVSFYFGARHHRKNQDFQRDMAVTMARAPEVMDNLDRLRDLRAAEPTSAGLPSRDNPALADWRAQRGR